MKISFTYRGEMMGQLQTEYRPSKDEPYMNNRQLDWFRDKLLTQKASLVERVERKVGLLRESHDCAVECIERSIQEADKLKLAKEIMKARKLLEGTEAALKRIRNGQFGFCILTGEEIGLKRLLARPTAPLCRDAQALLEREETLHQRG